MRLSYRFITPIITADRDFYVLQFMRRDFPEKGDISFYSKSLPEHPECPATSTPVRGNIFIAAFVFKPRVDEDGKDLTDFFMVTQVDIAGWIPKAAVNAFAWRVPRQTFQQLEIAAQNVHLYEKPKP